MERKNDDDWVKACQRLEVAGGRGRSKKTWRECVAEVMRVLGLEQSGVHDRLGWRKGIMEKPSDPRASMETTDVKLLIINRTTNTS